MLPCLHPGLHPREPAGSALPSLASASSLLALCCSDLSHLKLSSTPFYYLVCHLFILAMLNTTVAVSNPLLLFYSPAWVLPPNVLCSCPEASNGPSLVNPKETFLFLSDWTSLWNSTFYSRLYSRIMPVHQKAGYTWATWSYPLQNCFY